MLKLNLNYVGMYKIVNGKLCVKQNHELCVFTSNPNGMQLTFVSDHCFKSCAKKASTVVIVHVTVSIERCQC